MDKLIKKEEKVINITAPQPPRSYPFIDKLVDTLFNNDLNNLLTSSIETNSDKSVFMMFVNIYFMAYIHTQEQLQLDSQNHKQVLKNLLNDAFSNPEKRQMCISLIKQINPLFSLESITNTEVIKDSESDSDTKIQDNNKNDNNKLN